MRRTAARARLLRRRPRRASRPSSTTCAALGVTVLYLNPIFAAPSNHRYDTIRLRRHRPGPRDPGGLRGARSARPTSAASGSSSTASSTTSRPTRRGSTGSGASRRRARASRPTRHTGPGSRSGATGRERAVAVRAVDARRRPTPTTSGLVRVRHDPRGDRGRARSTTSFTGPDGVVRRWVAAGTAGWRLDVMDNLSHGFMRADPRGRQGDRSGRAGPRRAVGRHVRRGCSGTRPTRR